MSKVEKLYTHIQEQPRTAHEIAKFMYGVAGEMSPRRESNIAAILVQEINESLKQKKDLSSRSAIVYANGSYTVFVFEPETTSSVLEEVDMEAIAV